MNSRRSLLGISSAEYIKDGLMLWYDGIQNTRQGHNPNVNVWEDLSGNNIDGQFIGNIICNDNNLQMNTTSQVMSYVNVDNESIYFHTRKPCSFELVVSSPTKSSILGCVHPNDNTNEIWNVDANSLNVRFFARRYPASGALSIDMTKPHLISVLFDADVYANSSLSYYIDGVLKLHDYRNTDVNAYGLTLGWRTSESNAAYNSSPHLYSVRYYNRMLTEEEMLNNYKIDKLRFGIGG